MAEKTIGTADFVEEVPHDKCGKGIARVIDGVPHVECTRKGCREWVPLEGFVKRDTLRGAIDLIISGQIRAADVIALAALPDPLAEYRQIEGLIVVGPAELDKVCRSLNSDNPNPLGLADGWIPDIPVPDEWDQWIHSGIWRDDKNWQTRAALILTPPEIAGIPTSPIGQNKIWGVPHDGLPGGIVRQDVFWSNYFVKPNYDWANTPAVSEWQWQLGYEHPVWITRQNWPKQQKSAESRGMPVASVAADTFILNAVLAAYGVRLRASTYSRTSTVFDGYPLDVGSLAGGVCVRQHWFSRGCLRQCGGFRPGSSGTWSLILWPFWVLPSVSPLVFGASCYAACSISIFGF